MKWLNIRLKSKFMLVFCSLMLLSVATVLTTSVYVFHRYEKELYRDTSLVLNMSVDSIEQKLSAVDTASSYVRSWEMRCRIYYKTRSWIFPPGSRFIHSDEPIRH